MEGGPFASLSLVAAPRTPAEDSSFRPLTNVGVGILERLGAVFAMDAAQSIPGEQWALNRGSGGQALRARYGSVGRAEIRGGALLSSNAMAPVSGVATATVPYSPSWRMTANGLEVIARMERGNYWTHPLAFGSVSGGAERSWCVGFSQAGGFNTNISADGTTPTLNGDWAASGITFALGTIYWVRFRLVYNPGVSTVVYGSWAPDTRSSSVLPSSWSAETSVSSAAFLPFASTKTLNMLSDHTPVQAPGVLYRAILKDRADGNGATVFDVDFTSVPDLTTSFTCTTGHTVTVGSVSSIDSNDPQLLAPTPEKFVYFPDGPAVNPTNRATSPAVAYNTTGDVEWIVQTKGIDWSSSTRRTIAASWATGFLIDRFNATQLLVGNSNSTNNCYSLPPHGLSGVVDQWFRVRYLKSSGTWAVAKSADGANWTDITAATNTPSPGVNQPNFTTSLEVGGSDDLGAIGGRVPFVEMRNGIGGPALFRYDERDITSWDNPSTWVSSTGETWTIQRATSGRKTAVVARPIWLLGTDDYLNIADNDLLDFAAGQDFSIVWVGRQFPSTADYSVLLGKKQGGGSTPGWYVVSDTQVGGRRYIELGDGVTSVLAQVTGTGAATGALEVLVAVRAGGTLTMYRNGVAGTPVAAALDVSSTGSLNIGASSLPGQYSDQMCLAAAACRRALTTAEIAQIVNAYGGS